MNPLKEKFNEYNFVDHTDDVREDSAFLMLKGSEKYVSSINAANPKFTIGQLNIGLRDSNFVQIEGLDTNFIKWIDECYEINQKKFNNFFVTGTNGKSSVLSFLSQILSNQKINHASMGTH
jgi:UDP-N-acetylmuramyl tripeptide synthase